MDKNSTHYPYIRTSKKRFLFALLSVIFLFSNFSSLSAAGTADITKTSSASAAYQHAESAGNSAARPGAYASLLSRCDDPTPSPVPAAPSLSIDKTTNGSDGLTVAAGSAVTWSYKVTNTGNVKLMNISVTDLDPAIGLVGTITALPAGHSHTLTRQGTAVLGTYTNTGVAACTYVPFGVPDPIQVTASDTSSYTGIAAAISLNKTTNGTDGANIPVGAPLTWEYAVTNTGGITLTNIQVTDNNEGIIGTIASLEPGMSQTLTKAGTSRAGAYSNTGTASGSYSFAPADLSLRCAPTGIPASGTVTASDDSCYFGSAPGISISKTTNGSDGLMILTGAPVTWSYAVTNTGNVTLTNVRVTDSKSGDIGIIASLAPHETKTLVKTGTAVKGDYSNTATVYGTPPAGPDVTAADSSSYFGADPQISISKLTNGLDGPFIAAGSTVAWTYAVTNTGNVELTNILVTDSSEGFVGTIASLAPGASQTLTKTGTAHIGPYMNIGIAAGCYSLCASPAIAIPGGPPLPTVSACDGSSYFGSAPGIRISKTTNGSDGLTILAGEPITWQYAVTNMGNTTLTNVRVTDDKAGDIGTIASLAPFETKILTKTGTAMKGDYSNTATVYGTPPIGPDVSAADSSSYFGADPHISISKLTNGQDGSFAAAGSTVIWTYEVKNTGNILLTDILVTDSEEGSVGTIASLAPGTSQTLSLSGTAREGEYANTGTATGTYTLGCPLISLILGNPLCPTITASDDSSYFGSAPGISIDKTTNDSDGLMILAGDPITWKYEVTNTGNVTLTNIAVTDSDPMIGTVGTIPQLAAGETASLTHTGTAAAGVYSNTGTASGTPPVGQDVADSDISSYFGAVPEITINKTTNGSDGLFIPAGGAVTWSYDVTNTGNIVLTDITVTDSDLGAVGTIAVLPPDETQTLTMTGTAVTGAYANTGTAAGTYTLNPEIGESAVFARDFLDVELPISGTLTGTISDTDDSSYFGSAPAITIAKTAQNITTAGAASKASTGTAGDDFLFTLLVTNTGNVDLSDVTVTDSAVAVGSNAAVNGTLTKWVSGIGGLASLTIGSLTPGQDVTITYVYDTAPTDAAMTRYNAVAVRGIQTSTLNAEKTSVIAFDAATFTITSVLGVVRTVTPTPTPTAAPTTGVLGAAKTGENSNFSDIIAGLILLAASGGMLLFFGLREHRKNSRKG